jgi:hypothetical protein
MLNAGALEEGRVALSAVLDGAVDVDAKVNNPLQLTLKEETADP